MYKKSAHSKKEIMNATITLFKNKGYEKTGVRDIAKEADTSYTLIYYHFPKGKMSVVYELTEAFYTRGVKFLINYQKQMKYYEFIYLVNRFVYRQVLEDQTEFECYANAWCEYHPNRPLQIEIMTSLSSEGIDIQFSRIIEAFVISDSLWGGLYKAKKEGIIEKDYLELKNISDRIRWTYMGLSPDAVEVMIRKADGIIDSLPPVRFSLFDYTLPG